MEECKYGAQFCKDWFEQVKYWYDNDCMPSDEEQEWYATDWMETMLNCIDFEYDESKNPANMKKSPKSKKESPKTPKTPKKANEVTQVFVGVYPRSILQFYTQVLSILQCLILRRCKRKQLNVSLQMYKSPESPKRKCHSGTSHPESPESSTESKKAKVAPESPKKDKFKVSKKEFAEFRLCQKGALPMPEWFVKDKTKQNEVIERTDEIAAYYKI